MLELDAIFRKYNKRLLYFAMRYLPQLQAEEVVANVFVTMCRKQPVFESDIKARAWLYMVTSNECKDVLRMNKKIRRRLKDLPIEQDEQPIEYNIIRAEVADYVWKCIAELPPQCREVIEYRMIGRANQEIADLTHTSIHTVKNQYARGRALLRERMRFP